MHLGWHLAAGVAMGLVVGGEWAPIAVGMLGVDLIDHGVWGLIKVRPFGVKNLWRTANNLYKGMEAQLYFFHTIEVYLLMILLSYRFEWGRWFMLAYSTHLLMDISRYLTKRKKLDWAKKWSLCWWASKKYLTRFELVYKR